MVTQVTRCSTKRSVIFFVIEKTTPAIPSSSIYRVVIYKTLDLDRAVLSFEEEDYFCFKCERVDLLEEIRDVEVSEVDL